MITTSETTLAPVASPERPGPRHSGARVLYRHWQRPRSTAIEGFVREFSEDKRHVRISKTDMVSDAGCWYPAAWLRIEAVLAAEKQPMPARRRRKHDRAEEGDAV